jgi:L-alanine-DL-glutamate epimerase-like enolase superfamily enzyme
VSTIQAVEVCPVAVPLDLPIAFSSRAVQERHYTLVRVRDSDGVSGIGFCYAGHAGATVIAESVAQLLRPVLLGREVTATEALWVAMYQNSLLQGRAGAVLRGISAVDIALWDLLAQRAGLPLWRLLGAAREDTVPAYASGGYYRDGHGVPELVKEVTGYVEQGFTMVKIKVGRLTPDEEEARVSAVRAAIGPDTLLMLDANNAWRSVAEALPLLRRFEPYQPYWIEEPFSPDDLVSHQRLVGRTSALVATGEIHAGRREHAALLSAGAVEVLQPDAAVCGGVSEFRRIAILADAASVPVAPHWFDSIHAHLVASTVSAHSVEYFVDDTVFNFRRLLTRRLEVRSGELVLPDTPGLGFGFDESIVTRFALTKWD